MAGLRVVMLAPFGIRPKGTLTARMLPLGQALVRRGHRVLILAPPVQNPQDAGRREVLGGVTVVHTRLPRLPEPVGVLEQVGLLLMPALAARPDVLHCFKPKGYSGLAARAARWLRPSLPLVVDTDDWEGWGGWNNVLPYPMAAKRLFAWQERDLPRQAAAVTVASRTLETQVWGFGVDPRRVFYLPNGTLGIERSALSVPPATLNVERPVLRGVGPVQGGADVAGHELHELARMADDSLLKPQMHRSTHVGLRLLLYTRFWEFDVRDVVAVLAGVAARLPEVRLVVVGRGERGEEQDLRRLCVRAGLERNLEERGWLAPEAILAALASCDAALVPMDDTLINRARGLAKLLELMQIGMPIAATRVGQVAEYLEHGVSGLLVPPYNPGALAQAALALLENAELRATIGAGARRAALAFSWDGLAGMAERAYGRAVGR
jgi:glycosyltransferase involved in cell wall biosynthesis